MRARGDEETGRRLTASTRRPADLKTNGAELEARRRYLEIVLGNITAGVISTDGEGRITTMNGAAAALLGVDAARCVGRRLDAVCASDTFAEIRQLAADLLADVPATSSYPIT